MEETVAEETAIEGPLIERSTNDKTVLEGIAEETVNQKWEIDWLIVKSSKVEDLWLGSCSDGSLFFPTQ